MTLCHHYQKWNLENFNIEIYTQNRGAKKKIHNLVKHD